ncbi:MAG: serine/threonine protein phosphatase [Ruminococcus sp.]|nr:serine/threonine protein phosphatase [Ruminococcus sp.]
MGLFRKKQLLHGSRMVQTLPRSDAALPNPELDNASCQLYQALRSSVPILDAAINKIIRLTGSFTLRCEEASMQEALQQFAESVPVGVSGISLQTFADGYLDSLLTYGNAVGELLLEESSGTISGLLLARPDWVQIAPGKRPGLPCFSLRQTGSEEPLPLPHPERICFTALNPPPGKWYGTSILQGLPALSRILMRIYQCIGQNYDRMGNVRYAVTYRPSADPAEQAYAGDRARQIAKEWSKGMRAGAHGEVRDFICAGDVEIKVIGADNPLLDTEVPVRQLLEQLVAKLSIPPFLLGLNWSTTERMSAQQADLLTSELEYYRRLLTPVLIRIATAFLRLSGSDSRVTVEWSNINLQDETELAQARLHNAQAQEIEQRINHPES